MSTPRMTCSFVPPYLLERIATSSSEAAACCRDSLALDAMLRGRREARGRPAPASAAAPSVGEAPAWTIHTAENHTTLPGRPVRSAGEPASGDEAVDEAAAGVVGSLALFAEVYDRSSYDGSGAPVSVTVHYGHDYVNAFWDGTQLVFGDGDGKVFDRFTRPVDVLGHEFTHGVIQHSAGLAYQGQSGALNESVADAFAACLKQRLLEQHAAEADWLIGKELFLPGVQARALRDLAAPGTAYDDPVLGKDPQVGHLDDYVDTTDDNGGVHINSGIPNRAFQLAATAIGGRTWEGAGAIWYAALTGGRVDAATDFAGFAAATVAAAGKHEAAVRDAWAEVGVAGAGAEPEGPSQGGGGRGSVVVRRSGGFIGRTTEGMLDLDANDPRAAEARDLLARIDLRAVRGGPPYPDMYVFSFALPGSDPVSVPEHELTDDLRRLASLLLNDPDR